MNDYLPSGEAAGIEEAAAAWLERREREDWNEEARAELDRWLAQSATHAVTFLRIQDVWERADRLGALGKPTRQNTPRTQDRAGFPFVFRMAAAFVVLAGVVSFGAVYFGTPRYQTYMTTVGGREKLSLSDGSSIELNTNTVLRIVDDSGERKVLLDQGEAYFDIRHNPARPFVVMAAGHRVRDIGTKFVVRNDPGRLEVRLMQGSAQLESLTEAARPQMLAPGDVAIAHAGVTTLIKRSQTDLASQLGWRRGMLEFRHTSLAQAAEEFNRYSRERIVISDPTAAHAIINGALPVGDLDEFSRMARNFFGLRATRHSDAIVFSR